MNRLVATGRLLKTLDADCKRIGVISSKPRLALQEVALQATELSLKFRAIKSNGDERIYVYDTTIYFIDSNQSGRIRGIDFDLAYIDDIDPNPDLVENLWVRSKEVVRR